MDHLDVAGFLGRLAVMLGAAKLFVGRAQAVGQPAVLGELLAGVVLGKSVLGLVDPSVPVFHLLGELGVVILLFSIGMETDLKELLKAGASSTAVAVAGVVLPFVLGYACVLLLGKPGLVAVVAGAGLTATSVGITARVLADLGRLKDPEGQVILGAAILDDVIGLVILSVVAGLADGRGVSVAGVARTTAVAFGFLAAAVAVGRVVVPFAMGGVDPVDLGGVGRHPRADAGLRARLAGRPGRLGGDPRRVRRRTARRRHVARARGRGRGDAPRPFLRPPVLSSTRRRGGSTSRC